MKKTRRGHLYSEGVYRVGTQVLGLPSTTAVLNMNRMGPRFKTQFRIFTHTTGAFTSNTYKQSATAAHEKITCSPGGSMATH